MSLFNCHAIPFPWNKSESSDVEKHNKRQLVIHEGLLNKEINDLKIQIKKAQSRLLEMTPLGKDNSKYLDAQKQLADLTMHLESSQAGLKNYQATKSRMIGTGTKRTS